MKKKKIKIRKPIAPPGKVHKSKKSYDRPSEKKKVKELVDINGR